MQGRDIASEYVKSDVDMADEVNIRDIEYSVVMKFKINVFDPENRRV